MILKITSFFLLMSFAASSAVAQHATVNNTAELGSVAMDEESVIVKDVKAGGIFVRVDSPLTADNGVVFLRKAGGFWVRQFDLSEANVAWWGATGDGVHDDLPAIKAATAYCLKNKTGLRFSSGIFRITGQWVIGGKTLPEDDLFTGRFGTEATFTMRQHEIARNAPPLIIRGSVNTCIYGDFKARKLTAIIYYNIQANGLPYHPSSHLNTHAFINIGVYAQGYFKGATVTPPASVDTSNHQIGLVILHCNQSSVDGCGFFGLKYGLVIKSAYFGVVKNCNFELCQTGMSVNNYNANLIENIAGYYCKLLADISGAQLTINNLNSEFCESTMAINGNNIIINGVYCENYDLKLPNSCQLTFGHSRKDPVYNSKYFTTGITINMLTVSSGGRNIILLEDDMKQLNLDGPTLDGVIISKNPGNKIVINNPKGAYTFTGPGKKIEKED